MSEAAVISRHHEDDTSVPSIGSILIIDDEAAIRESLQTLLEMDGYETETAASGKEGLTRAGEKPFDLILLDVAGATSPESAAEVYRFGNDLLVRRL